MTDKNITGKPFPLLINELTEEKIKELSGQGYDINARIDKNGRTLLIEAAEAGNTELVRLLIKYGADVNIAEKKEKQTALLLACWEGHEETAKVLLENNADIHRMKSGNKTSLMYGAHSGKPGIVKMLIEKGAKLNAVNDEGQNALMYAADSDKKLEAFKVIVESGADINICDKEGKSVISWAAAHGSPEIMHYLIEKGARLDIIDSFGYNLLDYAAMAEKNRKEVMELAKSAGVKKLPLCFGFCIEIKCPGCGHPVMVNGPLRKVKCPSCVSVIDLNESFWLDVFSETEDDDSGSATIFGAFNIDLKFRKMNPVCPDCKTGIDASSIIPGNEGEIECSACKNRIQYFSPPSWLEEFLIKDKHPAQVIGALERDDSVSEEETVHKTVAINCVSCGAALQFNEETPRNATCNFCGAVQYITDAAWLSLHPVKKSEWWFIRLE